MTALLEASGLTKSYGGRDVVRGVSLAIHAGEIYGLLGPNGAGKTTVLGMVATLIAPDAGDARVSGRAVSTDVEAVRRVLGLVPQRIALYPALSIEENLRFFGRLYGLAGGRLDARVDAMLALSGLNARRGDVVTHASGGMQRRLNLACGLIHEPKLLLLDEPTVGIDPQSRERVFEAVLALAANGLAILYTTHYMEEAERLCHRVGILDEGRLVGEGTPAELSRLVSAGELVTLSLKDEPSPALRADLLDAGAVAAGPRSFRRATSEAAREVPELLRRVASGGGVLTELSVHRPHLGDVFFHLTGKELRD